MYTCSPDSQCKLRLVCIVTWRHGCPHVAVCLCPIHLICVPSTCMECAHASVHVFMPTWVLNSAPFPMHSSMETWMSLCGTVCFAVIPLLFPDLGENVYMHQYMYFSLPDSPCLLHSISILTWKDGYLCVALCVFQSLSPWSHILDRRCTCISTCTSVYLTPYVCFTLFAYLRGKMGSSVWQIVCLPVICFWSHTLFKMCTCISTLIYVLTWLHMSVPPHLYSFMKTWMPLCDIVCLSQSAYFWLHTFVRMCTCISTCIYVHLTPHFSLIPCG